MSAISEKCRTALYAKLNVSGVTSLATGGVHYQQAPDGTACPYLIFQRQGPAPIDYGFGPTLHLETDLWLVKSVTDEDSNTAKEPQTLGEEILAAAITALGTSLTLSGNTVTWYTRFSDIAPYRERLNDRDIYHQGFLWKVGVE